LKNLKAAMEGIYSDIFMELMPLTNIRMNKYFYLSANTLQNGKFALKFIFRKSYNLLKKVCNR